MENTLIPKPVIRADSATLRDCLLAIDAGALNATIAVDENDRIVGIVTDGDVRRGLLAGVSLDSPVAPLINRQVITAAVGESRANVLDIMRARGVFQVPIVTEDGRVNGIHTMRSLMGRSPRPNVALILAGGLGTRLRPLTLGVPKPMIPVAGRPILERLVIHLVGYGVERIVISVGHLGHMIEDHFGDGSGYGCQITYLHDEADKPLGSGGPLSLLRSSGVNVTEPMLVLNGDLVTQFNVSDLLEHHNRNSHQITIAATTHSYEIPFGVVATNESGSVIGLDEKPVREEQVSAGIYVINPELLIDLEVGRPFPITDLIAEAIERNQAVGTWSCTSEWVDVGRPDDLSRARGIQ